LWAEKFDNDKTEEINLYAVRWMVPPP